METTRKVKPKVAVSRACRYLMLWSLFRASLIIISRSVCVNLYSMVKAGRVGKFIRSDLVMRKKVLANVDRKAIKRLENLKKEEPRGRRNKECKRVNQLFFFYVPRTFK